MKEIKFRLWHKEKKLMSIILSPFECMPVNFDVVFVKPKKRKDLYAGEITFNLNEINVMQYTGLKDKNGKEIYFDDVVRVKFHDGDIKQSGTAVVRESMNYGAGIIYDYKDYDAVKIWAVTEGGVLEEIWEDDELWEFKIIGNIYENPELLRDYGTEKHDS